MFSGFRIRHERASVDVDGFRVSGSDIRKSNPRLQNDEEVRGGLEKAGTGSHRRRLER
jgi:hypothetical protein